MPEKDDLNNFFEGYKRPKHGNRPKVPFDYKERKRKRKQRKNSARKNRK